MFWQVVGLAVLALAMVAGFMWLIIETSKTEGPFD
jgi:hypothetical protein